MFIETTNGQGLRSLPSWADYDQGFARLIIQWRLPESGHVHRDSQHQECYRCSSTRQELKVKDENI